MMTFEEAYRNIRPRLAHYVRRRCAGTSVDADDAMQEIMLQAWLSWSTCRTDNVLAWLIGITRHVLSQMFRHLQRQKRSAHLVEWDADSDHRPSPPAQEDVVMLKQVQQHIDTLGPAQQVAIRGTMMGMMLSEIAEDHGVSRQAVHASIKLARTRLNELQINS